MPDPSFPQIAKTTKRWRRALLGALVPLVLLLSLGEAYLRFFPPDYLYPFLGEQSPLAGHLSPDADFGVSFASWGDLVKDNPVSLGPDSLLLPDRQPTPAAKIALVLGNSFGYHLAWKMRELHPERVTLTLERREKLTVRMAQIKALLEHGVRPDQIFLVVIPSDFGSLGEHELCHHTAGPLGGYVFVPNLPPGPAGQLLRQSRLAFSGWVRLGLHRDHPLFSLRQLYTAVPANLQNDQRHLFAALARLERDHRVPITVVMVPGRREMIRPVGFALEDTVVRIMREQGVRYLDPRPAFLAHANREELYVPDGHLSDLGNRLLVEQIDRQFAAPDVLAAGRGETP